MWLKTNSSFPKLDVHSQMTLKLKWTVWTSVENDPDQTEPRATFEQIKCYINNDMAGTRWAQSLIKKRKSKEFLCHPSQIIWKDLCWGSSVCLLRFSQTLQSEIHLSLQSSESQTLWATKSWGKSTDFSTRQRIMGIYNKTYMPQNTHAKSLTAVTANSSR